MAKRKDLEKMLAVLAGELGYDLNKPAAEPPSEPTRRRRQYRSVASGSSEAPAKTGGDKPKPHYGQAPAMEGPHSVPDARATHKARLDALEAAIPGITSVAYVFSVGKDANNRLTKQLGACVNNPFTYVELPGGKNQTVGNLDPDTVRKHLKACGYGFTRQTDRGGATCFFWATDSNGRPVRRLPFKGYQKRNIAARLVNDDS